MASLPLHVLSLIVDQCTALEDVKHMSLCAKSWRNAAASRLFHSISLSSSHTHGLLCRMRTFAPQHAHRVRRVTFNLSFTPHRGHRGFVVYNSANAHTALAETLGTVLTFLPNVNEVALNVNDASSLINIDREAYTPLIAALYALKRWRSLLLNVQHVSDVYLPVLAEVIASASAVGVSRTCFAAHQQCQGFIAFASDPQQTAYGAAPGEDTTMQVSCGQQYTLLSDNPFSVVAPL